MGETVPDLKEFWHHGPVIDDSYDERIMKNIYVNEIDEFNTVFDELFKDRRIGKIMLQIEKLEILKHCSSVGIKISKKRSHEKL